jgi:hypothetical protein
MTELAGHEVAHEVRNSKESLMTVTRAMAGPACSDQMPHHGPMVGVSRPRALSQRVDARHESAMSMRALGKMARSDRTRGYNRRFSLSGPVPTLGDYRASQPKTLITPRRSSSHRMSPMTMIRLNTSKTGLAVP